MRCLLLGNYGAGNLGDELLQRAFRQQHRSIEWITASANPNRGEVPRLPFGLRSLIATPWWKTVRALRACDVIVFGGGTLLTDTETVRACLLWWWHGFVARVFRKPILLADQGIGPFQTRVGEWCARWIVAQAGFISVRDRDSEERMRTWKKNTKVILSFDPVFPLVRSQIEEKRTKKVFTFIPKNSTGWGIERIERFRRASQGESRAICLDPERKGEPTLAQRLCGELMCPRTLEEAMDAIAGSRAVLTQRYHGAVLALGLGMPCAVIGDAPGDKLMALASELKLPAVLLHEWDGDPRPLLAAAKSLPPEQRMALLHRCEEGRRALDEALHSLHSQF